MALAVDLGVGKRGALSLADVLLAAQALRRYCNRHESVSTQNQAG
ncbi:hypothetical protein [Corynebacterium striatum]|nr:hypothetical protein [Corynebacterium striatum]